MSLILDALNRSRDEVNAVPNLATHHPVEPVSLERKRTLPWVALAVALLLIAWLVVDRFTASPAPAADIGAPVAELTQNIGSAAASVTTELKARAAAHEEGFQPRAVEVQPVEAQPVEELASRTAVIDEAKTAEISRIKSPEKTTAVVAVAPAAPRPAKNNAAVARLYQNRDAVDDIEVPSPNARTDVRPEQVQSSSAVADRNEQTIDIEEVLQRAQEEAKDASLDDHPVSLLSNLSQQTKDDIPTLYYQRHDYSVDSAISSVVLNGKKVTVGGSPISGLKVDEILVDSVVLSYRGTQFRLRALNSWINL